MDNLYGHATSTDDAMAVDTSFLDAYRRSAAQSQTAPEAEMPVPPALERDHEPAPSPVPELDPTSAAGRDGGDTAQRGGDTAQRGGNTAQGGGGGGAGQGQGANGSSPAPGGPTDTAVFEDTDAAVLAAVLPSEVRRKRDEPAAAPPVSLQHTDHQDAVQSAAGVRGGGNGSGDGNAVLPQSRLNFPGMTTQPTVKGIPDLLINELREQLRAAAVRELGVSDKAARKFSSRASQGTLVTAFLLAQLDLRLDADPATLRAAELFRACDPLLGSVATRMANLERLHAEHTLILEAVRTQLRDVQETGSTIEHAVAYTVADREENFLRGSHDIHAAPFTHRTVLAVRDRVRAETKKQTKLERDREGRPIR